MLAVCSRRSLVSILAAATMVGCIDSPPPPAATEVRVEGPPQPPPPASEAPIAATADASVARGPGALEVAVEGSAFRVTLPDGHVLSAQELVGVVMTVRDESNAWRKIRVDRVEHDPRDPDITLYAASVQDPRTGAWGSLCGPGPDGLALAMPLAGVWTADGRHTPADGEFNVTCTSGAIGKCVRFGYKPWARAADGTSLWDYHEACVRMVRADYCGDGVGTTRDGMLINIDDRLGIQRLADDPSLVLEAGWGPDGALCVHHPRVPENVTLAQLEARCPDRLRGRTGPVCSRELFADDPRFRVLDHSAAPAQR